MYFCLCVWLNHLLNSFSAQNGSNDSFYYIYWHKVSDSCPRFVKQHFYSHCVMITAQFHDFHLKVLSFLVFFFSILSIFFTCDINFIRSEVFLYVDYMVTERPKKYM